MSKEEQRAVALEQIRHALISLRARRAPNEYEQGILFGNALGTIDTSYWLGTINFIESNRLHSLALSASYHARREPREANHA